MSIHDEKMAKMADNIQSILISVTKLESEMPHICNKLQTHSSNIEELKAAKIQIYTIASAIAFIIPILKDFLIG